MDLTQYTVNNYKNLKNITAIKFKGRKSINLNKLNTFNSEEYVILHKFGDKYYSIATDLNTNEQYKIIYDSSFTIIDSYFEVQSSDLNNNNESFFIKSTLKL